MSVLNQLKYTDPSSGLACSLPDWAELMVSLGQALAEADPGERRFVIGVTLPTRGFAAALAVCAYVVRRNALDPMEPSDEDLHFDELRALPEGTAIKLLHDDLGAADEQIVMAALPATIASGTRPCCRISALRCATHRCARWAG